MSNRQYRFHFLLHAATLLEDELRQRLAPLGLGPRQARVIDALSRMGAVSQVRLAREFNITQASMSTMTTRLIKAGLIARRKDPDDPRGNLLSLTEQGQQMMVEIAEVWQQIDAFAADQIGPTPFARLTEDAKALRDVLGGKRPGDHGAG